MTTKVTITHASPGYPSIVKVVQLDAQGVAMGTSTNNVQSYTKLLKDGESHDFYVHDGVLLSVSEIKP